MRRPRRPARILPNIALFGALIGVLFWAPGPALAGEAVTSADLAFGPQVLLFYGAPEAYRSVHTGITISTELIFDPVSLREDAEALPWPWGWVAGKARKRVDPVPFLPDSLILSPGGKGGGAWGLSWGIGRVGVDVLKSPRIRLSGGGRLTWVSIFEAPGAGGEQEATHFLRPGVDLGAALEIPLSSDWRLALGYRSEVYIPQGWGEAPWGLGTPGERLWHLGQLTLTAHRIWTRTLTY